MVGPLLAVPPSLTFAVCVPARWCRHTSPPMRLYRVDGSGTVQVPQMGDSTLANNGSLGCLGELRPVWRR